MRRRGTRSGRLLAVMLGSLYVGAVAGWFLHARLAPMPRETAATEAARLAPAETAIATTGKRPEPASPRRGESPPPPASGSVAPGTSAVAELRARRLRLPVDEASVEAMEGGFDERRGGGARGHEAVDILAPRHTPVRAVEDGTIAKLYNSAAGGITLYQLDPSQRFCYYYAHLQRYADGIREGQTVSRGDVIGYVGTTGNAPANTPHLHFAIYTLADPRRWWDGEPLDPYLIFGNPKTD